MRKMGKYCKAYPIKRFREYQGWFENSQNARPEKTQDDSADAASPRTLGEEDYLYLQENFVVTDGIFLEENVIYDGVTPEWIAYCKDVLKFEVPVFETPASEERAEQSAGA